MTIKDLENHIKLAKKHKLQSMTIGQISFILREPVRRMNIRAVTQGEIPITGNRMPSDEEMLFYSSVPAIQNPKSN